MKRGRGDPAPTGDVVGAGFPRPFLALTFSPPSTLSEHSLSSSVSPSDSDSPLPLAGEGRGVGAASSRGVPQAVQKLQALQIPLQSEPQ